jgi:hypothetical protein
VRELRELAAASRDRGRMTLEREDLEIPQSDPEGSAAAAAAALDAADPDRRAGGEGVEGTVAPDARSSETPNPPAASTPRRPPPKPHEAPPIPDGRITARQVKDLRKDQLATLLLDRENQISALNVRILELSRDVSLTDVGQQNLIDKATLNACAATLEFVGNAAAVKFGPEAQLTDKERDRLAPLWADVFKLYAGQHAKHSPLVAAILATGAVALDKYVTITTSPPAKAELRAV